MVHSRRQVQLRERRDRKAEKKAGTSASSGPAADTMPGGDGGSPSKRRNYWWNDKDRVLTIRYNSDARFIADQLVSEVPDAILECMTSHEDTAELCNYAEEDLPHLQANLAFSSAMVGRFIAQTSHERGRSLKEMAEASSHFEQDRSELLAKVAALEARAAAAEEGFEKEKGAMQERIDKLMSVCKTSAKLAEEQAGRLVTERTSWEEERKSMQAQIAELTKGMAAAVEEALTTYKGSDEFLLEVSEYARACFDALKDALVTDGCVERSIVDKYDYLTCLLRDGNGEFENLSK